jgi:hypothetical protein
MRAINILQNPPASKNSLNDLRILLSCLAGVALLLLAIYALSVRAETDSSAIVSSVVSP